MESVRRWMRSPAIVAPATTSLPQAQADARAAHPPAARRRCRGRVVGIVTECDINRVSDSPATDVRDYNL